MLVSTSTQTHRYSPKLFDVESDVHDKELKEWCRLHWQHTVCKGIQSYNAPTYHDCCVSFSKKNCVKKMSHPSIQSASVLKIPSLRNGSSHEELYRWLKERLRVHGRLGKKTYFPSINTAHFDDDDEHCEDKTEDMELLGKRFANTLHELDKARDEIHRLQEDNKKLLSASKSWCAKYQEIAFKHLDDTASYAQSTPLKPLKIQDVDDLLNL